jgi:hypothetical protein
MRALMGLFMCPEDDPLDEDTLYESGVCIFFRSCFVTWNTHTHSGRFLVICFFVWVCAIEMLVFRSGFAACLCSDNTPFDMLWSITMQLLAQ